MKRFVEGEDRRQATLLPACLDDQQMVVEAEHHLIVAHEVTNVGNDCQATPRFTSYGDTHFYETWR